MYSVLKLDQVAERKLSSAFYRKSWLEIKFTNIQDLFPRVTEKLKKNVLFLNSEKNIKNTNFLSESLVF